MSLELLNTVASVLTFCVIGVTAIAAFRQLPVLRETREVAALTTLLERWEAPAMRDAYRFLTVTVPQRLAEPDFRAGFFHRPVANHVREVFLPLNFFETLGIFVRLGVIREEAALRFYWTIIARAWECAGPVIAILRRTGPCYENFEYLAYRAGARRATAFDDYPIGVPRMPLTDPWFDADVAGNSL